ncbi:MAG: cation-transporting P-type ATPase, partial [Caldimonas sp.]
MGPVPDWHAQSAEQVLQRLRTGLEGLTLEEARRRLAEHGPNRLAEVPPVHPLWRLARQFHNLLIYVLLMAAAVTGAMGHWVDTTVILAVV